MSVAKKRSQTNSRSEEHVPWREVLDQETRRLEASGAAAGLLSVELLPAAGTTAGASVGQLADAEEAVERAIRLLTVILGPTDKLGRVSSTRLGLVHTPVSSIVELNSWTHRVARMLAEAEIDCVVGFARRRQEETLVETLARADAELDRTIFRSERSHGRLSLS